MMTIIDIKNYQPTSQDIFIFDSNIWIYLFDNTYIPENYIARSIDIYTDFYKKILNTKAKILISSFNVKEISQKFINNDIRNFKLANPNSDYKKDYRPTQAYNNLLTHIKSVNQNILKSAEKISDNFESFDNNLFFNTDIDFVDEYLGFLSEKNNCKLITHDKDFKECPFDIDILTDNKYLLRL